ncbi:MAG TPA: hypothetical protein VLQ48_03275 [Chloroflexia bacterium]|nr:hypothetical protein [Chloroflexia bacterium]
MGECHTFVGTPGWVDLGWVALSAQDVIDKQPEDEQLAFHVELEATIG